MKVRIRFESKIPKWLGVKAIVLYPYMLYAGKPTEIPKKTVVHEWEHIHQIRAHGFLTFYSSYVFYFLINLLVYLSWDKAYWEIPWEVKARDAEEFWYG